MQIYTYISDTFRKNNLSIKKIKNHIIHIKHTNKKYVI